MRYLIACILFFSTQILSAQLNPKNLYVNGKVDAVNTVLLKSINLTPTVTVLPVTGSDSLAIYPTTGINYELSFEAPDGFEGDVSMVVEYYENGPFPGIKIPNYTTVHFRIESSKIDLLNDYVLVDGDTSSVDVLINDSSTDGSLDLVHLGQVEGGNASILNNELSFVFDQSVNHGYVRYFAADSTDNIEGSKVYLTRLDSSLTDSRNLFVDNKSEILLYLSSNDFEIDLNATRGSLENIAGSHIWSYDPYDILTGIDTFSFSTPSGGLIEYSVDVLAKANDNSFLVDDEVFVATNDNVVFNVFNNDYRNDQSIYDYSPELTYNGNGEFEYTPPQDFVGDKTFFYKIYTGLGFHTGNITVHISEFAPTDNLDYVFTILKEHDLTFTHHSPISAYTIEVLVDPSHGDVIVLDANGQEVLECETISGENTVIYLPDAGFSGLDEFDLEYCTLSGECDIVKIDVSVVDTNFDECLCLTSCVYEGDNNDDGVVNMKDLIDLGLNIGEGGAERTNDFPLIWTGQESNDWGFGQMNSGIDLKCGDSDGNGYVDHTDIDNIEEHYGALHKLTADFNAASSDVPVYFIPPPGPVDSGEWLVLDIAIGNASFPAIDFYGSSFTFNFDPDLVDSASVEFTVVDEDNWLSYESPLKAHYKVPQDGQIDIGVTRVSNTSADGIGIIGQLKFIVEDETIGFKRSQLEDVLNLKMTNIISANEHGQYSSHKDFEQDIKINKDKEFDEIVLSNSISITPNPSSDFVSILSDRFSIDNVQVFDVLGKSVVSYSESYSSNYRIDISSLPEGMYFLTITSNGATTVEKLQKID